MSDLYDGWDCPICGEGYPIGYPNTAENWQVILELVDAAGTVLRGKVRDDWDASFEILHDELERTKALIADGKAS